MKTDPCQTERTMDTSLFMFNVQPTIIISTFFYFVYCNNLLCLILLLLLFIISIIISIFIFDDIVGKRALEE